jgi:hypothetical protein
LLATLERNNTMSETDRKELDSSDAGILTSDVSDEALESSAGTGNAKAGAWTLGACTGISVCPG